MHSNAERWNEGNSYGIMCEVLLNSKGNPGLNRYELKNKEFSSGIYFVKLISGKSNDEKLIKMECSLNGHVHLELVDLLGNNVMTKDLNKTNYFEIIPLEKNLTNGIYFISVKVDNNMIYYNKINILK